ncbi:Glycosyl hydrolase 108 [Humidesulfovibrio mexicanus]|uniref:Glycosyl hydrolase 108 n=1 Tax=Humidesulfovibrio mexicanus TaxID=147047 RepID=A0A239AVC6_9BACT|nr:glycosyl hydrolase 108 family protein [Humidesulfovibrio mexicanus]SNR99291.1 Glycosyl hydrolase 108 [Humidesulfovibrio mexicanus]
MKNLDICMNFTLGPSIEGGFSDNPNDPGGATNHGVSIRAHREDIGDKDHDGDIDADDVKLLTLEDAKAIFQADYFAPCNAGQLPAPLALMVVDFAYNSGVRVACKKLQERLGVTADGKVGPHTLAVGNALSPNILRSVINAYAAARIDYLEGLSGWPIFGGGWESRVKAVREAALKLVEG